MFQPVVMNESLVVRDPLYNRILVDLNVMHLNDWENPDVKDIQKVIHRPDYMIVSKEKKEIFFFRFMPDKRNILIIVHKNGTLLYACEYIKNPGAGYVAGVLKKGILKTFTY